MRVLWFERNGRRIHRAASYPPLAVACATTHDLATLAGWWPGADIAEKAKLGFLTPYDEQQAYATRLREKSELAQALIDAGLIAAAPDFDLPLPDSVAGAVHAFIGRAASILATAQVDDLAGETVATNLPGTDRERPNWRHRLSIEVEALFSSERAKAIVDALAAERR